MGNRRLAWAVVACLTGSLAIGVGCRGESASSHEGAPSTSETEVDVSAGKTASRLFSEVADAFRVREGLGAPTAMLTGSPIERFTTDGSVVHAVPLPTHRREPSMRVALPRTADGAMSIESAGVSVSVKPQGFAASPLDWSNKVAVYADVAEGVHAFRRVDRAGVEDFYRVESPRDTLTFRADVTLEHVAGLRLVGGTLELLDAGGAPRLRVPAPHLVDAHGALRMGAITVEGCAYDANVQAPWGRPVTAPGATSCVVSAQIDGRGLAYPVLVDPAWVGTFNTTEVLAYHHMLVLPAGSDAGKVLSVGGLGDAGAAPQTELFDPGSNSWASAGLPNGDTIAFGPGSNAVVLSDGTVILAGGLPSTSTFGVNARASALRRSPTGVWSPAGTFTVGRAWFAMQVVTVAGKEQVIVAGGQNQGSLSTTAEPLATAELYDPSVNAWRSAGTMSIGHTLAGSAKLASGKVLVAGGSTSDTTTTSAVAEIYDPSVGSTGAWTTTGALTTARQYPIVVALAGGGAFIGGGFDSTTSRDLQSAEYYDGTGFTALTAKMTEGRTYGAGVLLEDGRVLLTGGQTYDTSAFSSSPNNSADLFVPGADPKTGTIIGTTSMAYSRRYHALASIPGKGALVTGGDTGSGQTSDSELYDTTLGGACGASCPTGNCTEGVCCVSASCPEGQSCATPGHEGVCTKPQGAACGSASECATGHCVEGVCCDTACSGQCKSCAATGSVGTCKAATPGTDPGNKCRTSGFGDPICGAKCDATGSCFLYPPTTTLCGASAVDSGTDGGIFCSQNTCDGFGGCTTTTNNCGLTCTTSVTCDETTRTCTASSGGVKAGFCVIDSNCWVYGDINPKDACEKCDPPTSATSWLRFCGDGGPIDTGVDTGTDTGSVTDTRPDTKADTGTPDTGKADTGSAADTSATSDTGSVADASAPADTGGSVDDLPSKSACSCHTPGDAGATSGGATLAALLAVGAVFARRRRG